MVRKVGPESEIKIKGLLLIIFSKMYVCNGPKMQGGNSWPSSFSFSLNQTIKEKNGRTWLYNTSSYMTGTLSLNLHKQEIFILLLGNSTQATILLSPSTKEKLCVLEYMNHFLAITQGKQSKLKMNACLCFFLPHRHTHHTSKTEWNICLPNTWSDRVHYIQTSNWKVEIVRLHVWKTILQKEVITACNHLPCLINLTCGTGVENHIF